MQVEVEKLDGVHVRLQFEVSSVDCDRDLGRAYQLYASRKRLPGFRPGKVPVRRIKQEARGVVTHQVSEQIIEKAFRKAVDDEGLRPVTPPKIEGRPQVEEGQPFRFTINLEVRPEIDLKQVAGLKVEVEKKVCTDADLDAELERLQRTRTEWSEVDSDEVVAETHRVRVKFTATLEDEVLAEDQVQTFTLDDVSLEPDIKAALIGKKVGEPFEASITFSEDNPNEKLRGQAVAHRFELELIEEGELPALDDELAKAVGLEDFENLKEQVKASLEYRFEQGYQTEMEEKVLDQLIENNPLEVPPGLVNSHLDRMVRQALQGIPPERYDEIGLDLEKLREEARPGAVRAVQAGLLLEEIAEAEELEPAPQDLAQEMARMSREMGQPLAAVQQKFKSADAMAGIIAELRNRKALAFVVDAAENSLAPADPEPEVETESADTDTEEES
ncbi:MAG: trigger factor [Myxococcota bacterium]|jgi:trigger factor|nr:trigger factor [Myxococcota bacterium]